MEKSQFVELVEKQNVSTSHAENLVAEFECAKGNKDAQKELANRVKSYSDKASDNKALKQEANKEAKEEPKKRARKGSK